MADLLPFIYHERQEAGSMLCAAHALNALLQSNVFSPQDLAQLAQELDALEQAQLDPTDAFQSSNYDDSGFFSIAVLEQALSVYDVSLVRWKSQDLAHMHSHPEMHGFILNHVQHWYTIRRFGDSEQRWYNLDSCADGPTWISPLYLGLTMREAELQGYSIFAVVPNHSNGLPHCQADDAALTQSASASNGRAPHASSSRSAQSKKRRQSISDDAESGSDASEKRRRINGISDTAERLSEEDQMALAIAVSLEASKIDDRAPQNRSTSQPKTDEEDDSPSIEELRRRRLARFG